MYFIDRKVSVNEVTNLGKAGFFRFPWVPCIKCYTENEMLYNKAPVGLKKMTLPCLKTKMELHLRYNDSKAGSFSINPFPFVGTKYCSIIERVHLQAMKRLLNVPFQAPTSCSPPDF